MRTHHAVVALLCLAIAVNSHCRAVASNDPLVGLAEVLESQRSLRERGEFQSYRVTVVNRRRVATGDATPSATRLVADVLVGGNSVRADHLSYSSEVSGQPSELPHGSYIANDAFFAEFLPPGNVISKYVLTDRLPGMRARAQAVVPTVHRLATAVEGRWPPTGTDADPQNLDEYLTTLAADGFSISVVRGEEASTGTLHIEILPPSERLAQASVEVKHLHGHYVVTEWRAYTAGRYDHPVWLSERTYTENDSDGVSYPRIESYRLRVASSHSGFDPSDPEEAGIGYLYMATVSDGPVATREDVVSRTTRIESLARDRGVSGDLYMSEYSRGRNESDEYVLEGDGNWRKVAIRRETDTREGIAR